MLIKKYIINEKEINWISYKTTWPEAWQYDKIRFKPLITEGISQDLYFGIAELDPRETHQLHHHDEESELYYILKGTAKVQLNEECTEVGPGTAVYIPAKMKHAITNIGNETLVFVWAYNIPRRYEKFHWDVPEMKNLKKKGIKP
jgi:mannose-6-phosphate isomerase-like protein (cupin superfamily)